MTTFNVREPSSGEPMNADERANLMTANFDVDTMDERWPEYGQRSLLRAYRAGFLDGLNQR